MQLSPLVLALTLAGLVAGKHSFGADYQSDEGAKTLSAFIDKAIQAHGGSQRLAVLKGQVWKAKVTYHPPVTGTARPFTANFAYLVPDKVKAEYTGTFTVIYNGKRGWINRKEISAEQLQQQKDSAFVGWVSSRFPLKDKGFTCSLQNEIDVHGVLSVGVKVSHAGYRSFTIYFAKDTGLMTKVVTHAPASNGKESTQETLFSDYQVRDGIQVPMKYTNFQDGKILAEGEITEWKAVTTLEESLFEKPEVVPQNKKDADQFQGTWKLVQGTTNGKELTEDQVRSFRLSFNGDQLQGKKNEKVVVEGRFKLASNKSPAEIDLVLEEGIGKGIYQLSGDKLKIVHGEANSMRPTSFESTVGSQRTLMVLERVTK